MDKQMTHAIIKTWIQDIIIKLYELCKNKEEREMLNYITLQIHKLEYK